MQVVPLLAAPEREGGREDGDRAVSHSAASLGRDMWRSGGWRHPSRLSQ